MFVCTYRPYLYRNLHVYETSLGERPRQWNDKGGNPLSYATEIIIEIKQFYSDRMVDIPSSKVYGVPIKTFFSSKMDF